MYAEDRYEDEVTEPWIAIWSGEEVEVTFSAIPQQEDYGVEGSPTWFVPEDVTVEDVKIFGNTVELKTLPQDLQHHINSLAEDVEWPPL